MRRITAVNFRETSKILDRTCCPASFACEDGHAKLKQAVVLWRREYSGAGLIFFFLVAWGMRQVSVLSGWRMVAHKVSKKDNWTGVDFSADLLLNK